MSKLITDSGISVENWASLHMLLGFSLTFFYQKFRPGSPQGFDEKQFSSKRRLGSILRVVQKFRPRHLKHFVG
jgi:hypothetical protein